jgi:hypothetical protein
MYYIIGYNDGGFTVASSGLWCIFPVLLAEMGAV